MKAANRTLGAGDVDTLSGRLASKSCRPKRSAILAADVEGLHQRPPYR